MERIAQTFDALQVTPSQFLLYLLTTSDRRVSQLSLDLTKNCTQIADAFLTCKATKPIMHQWCIENLYLGYVKELQELVDVDSGWHFNALHTHADQIKSFRIDSMAVQYQRTAPRLWELLGRLLGGKRGYDSAHHWQETAMDDDGVFLEGMDIQDKPRGTTE